MAWVAPPTFVSGNALTAAQLNILSDDLLETAAGKATTTSRLIVTGGANSIVQRIPNQDFIGTTQGTSSTTYGDLTNVGPTCVVATGTNAYVWWSCRFESAVSSGAYARMSVAVSSSSSISASDARAVEAKFYDTNVAGRYGTGVLFDNLTAGTNTFTAKYRTNGTSVTFGDRRLLVLPL